MADNDDIKAEMRQRFHSWLDVWLDLHFRFYQEAPTQKRKMGAARIALMDAADAIATICGEEFIAHAYRGPIGRAPNGPAETLQAIGHRLTTAASLFGRIDHRLPDAASLLALADEARLAAAGEAPRTFVKAVAKKHPREVRLRRRALEWGAYLDELGVPDAHKLISAAYGGEQWNTIGKWADIVVQTFGQADLDGALRYARMFAGMGDPLAPSTEKDWQNALAADGAAFVNRRKSGADLQLVQDEKSPS
jgi:hypothetical protein